MPTPSMSDALCHEAVEAAAKYGSVTAAAAALRLNRSTFRSRLDEARRRGIESVKPVQEWTFPAELFAEVRNGSVLIGGDAHFWPGQDPLIWRAFVDVAQYLKPQALILNGDLFDGTRISRHGRLRGQNAPTVKQELEATARKLGELPHVGNRFYTLGNHDMRVNTYLANMASEMDDLGVTLPDWFPNWEFCYAVTINDNVEVRHRYRNGIHARYTNTVNAGRSIVTNHTHGLGVTPFEDRNGRRWGVETGTLNWVDAPQMEYNEGTPSRACPGFAVLTFDGDGNLLPPELAEWVHGKVWFRGMSWGFGKPRISVRSAA